jgi:hypothetical protein
LVFEPEGLGPFRWQLNPVAWFDRRRLYRIHGSRNDGGIVEDVMRQKKKRPVGEPSNQFLANEWWVWEAKARASQMLMSGRRNIVVIKELRDAIRG